MKKNYLVIETSYGEEVAKFEIDIEKNITSEVIRVLQENEVLLSTGDKLLIN